MRARFKSVLFFIILLLLVSLGIGFFYTVYTRYLNGEPEIKIVKNLSINYKDGMKFYVKKEKTINFSVINNSSEEEYYFIAVKDLKNVQDADYTLTKNGVKSNPLKLPIYDEIISNYILIEPNTTDNYVLHLNNNKDESFSLSLDLDVVTFENKTFAQALLKNNKAKSNPATTPGKDIAITNEGLIQTSDDTGTAYYFRGAIENNYELINGLYFRVLRINGDGTVSLVLNTNTNTLKKYYEKADLYKFNDTSLKDYLNTWAEENIKDDMTYVSTYGYCNEYEKDSKGVLNSYTRIVTNNITSLVCLGDKVKTKVGLLTIDDAILAGASLKEPNSSFYLYSNKINTSSYLMSGATITKNIYYPFILETNGMISYKTPGNYLRGIRPVITVFESTSVKGNGTYKDPYILTNN